MARDVMILDEQMSPDGSKIARGVFWIDNPPNLVKRIKGTRVSQVPDVTPQEQADLDNGLKIEVAFDSGQYPPSTQKDAILEDLLQRRADAQAALSALNPPDHLIGVGHDSITGKWT